MDVHCVLRCVISRRVPCYGCALCASLCDHAAKQRMHIHSRAGRIISMKNSNDNFGNRTRDLLASSAMLQTTAPPAACPLPFNPLNAELNPIFHLLALLVAHHILYVSRIRVNSVGVISLWMAFVPKHVARKLKVKYIKCRIVYLLVLSL